MITYDCNVSTVKPSTYNNTEASCVTIAAEVYVGKIVGPPADHEPQSQNTALHY
jgi:hypothetical protein